MTNLTSEQLGDGDLPIPELYRSGRAKRRRSQQFRFAAYAAGLTTAVAIGLTADWATIGDKYFNPEIAKALFPDIITVGAKNTLTYTAFAFVGGVILGLGAALLRLSSIRPYRWIAAVYIEIFRGLPAILTITLVGFLTPIALGFTWPKILGVPTGGVVALALVAGAYLAETVRAGLEAVPKGQVEAARSLGMTQSQTLRRVVVPQAFRIVIPPLTNEFVLLLKDTSLLSILGFLIEEKEITKFGRDAAQKGFNGTPLVVAGMVYLVITIPLTRLVAVLERRNKANQ